MQEEEGKVRLHQGVEVVGAQQHGLNPWNLPVQQ